jgi:hypothetical protein
VARDILRVWVDVDRIHCYDEGDGLGTAEPYLWTVFFKIDGESAMLTEDLKLSGSATVVGTIGSHGNLGGGGVDAGDDIAIPNVLGEWTTSLVPIPVPPSLRPVAGDDLPGIAGVVCVLMEEDNVTDDGAEAGREALAIAVAGALADIIATRSFSNPTIGPAEIDQYLDAVAESVEDAIKAQQGFFEDIWSWLNKDDQIGSKVFFWTYDDLKDAGTIPFSQRWGNDGDWEIFGRVNGTVSCSAEAIAAVSEIINAIFGRVAGDMRSFRDRDFGGNHLGRWWSLADRNAPQLARLLSSDEKSARAVAELLGAVPNALSHREGSIPDGLLELAHGVLTQLRASGSRHSRLDASRAQDLLAHMRGRTYGEAIELLAAVPPGRTPRPLRDVRHLLSPEHRAPTSLSRPIEQPNREGSQGG